MVIDILGTGCKHCKQLKLNTDIALARLKIEAEVRYITDMATISESGILRTPGLRINGQVISQGKVLAPIEIMALIEKES
jgi:small redox-active disulfide protein 2